ncbi:Putative aryl-alcohol dehydrogenase AAD14 [Cytospora mali]|uniref:Aryl-alcohol dehydrogenase AAD14 n=1 Tax=Cytospora mali TaxID=578113 RepID=A0A194WBH7_CYTMA|nr:Putative aryl-alcohol dehydrogenase AAD14 [Valsa mali]
MSGFFQPVPEPPTELGRLRILSSTAGIRVSPLQLGAMSLGSSWSHVLGSNSKEEVFKLLDAFVEAGGNFIDTANQYQNEESEKWIGEWMAERKNRDQLVVATKYTMDYASHRLGGPGKTPNHAGNHKRAMYMSVRDSLAKLQTDYIDILYLHAWDHTTSIKEIMDSLHFLVAERKVLYIGISDTPAWVVSAANVYANENGKTPFSIYQGRWSVLERDFERDIIPMARHFGMALAPFNVLGGGRLQTAKQLSERKEKIRGAADLTEDEVRMSEALAKVAAEHEIESIHAIALAYVMHKAPNVFPIVGCRKVEQLKDNIQALSIKLTDEQIQLLEGVKKFELGFPLAFIGEDPNATGHNWLLATWGNIAFPNAWKY